MLKRKKREPDNNSASDGPDTLCFVTHQFLLEADFILEIRCDGLLSFICGVDLEVERLKYCKFKVSAILVKMLCFILFMGVTLSVGENKTYNAMKNLTATLFTDYDTGIRPVLNQEMPVIVELHFRLVSLFKVDEQQKLVGLNCYVTLKWTDENLFWDPAQYDNITEMYPPSSNVWFPIITLFNSMSDSVDIFDMTNPVPLYLNHTGLIVENQHTNLETNCPLDVTKFPYDKHTCGLYFHPLTYIDSAVVITAKNINYKPTWNTGFFTNGEWDVLSVSSKILPNSEISFVIVEITFQRQPGFFILNLLFPTSALSLLNIFVFILPADSGEKVGFSITVLLSVMLFLSSTTEQLPPSSNVIPLITQYMTILTIISILSVVATVVTLLVHHKEEQQERQNNLILKVIRKMRAKKSASKSSFPNPFTGTSDHMALEKNAPKDITSTHFNTVFSLLDKKAELGLEQPQGQGKGGVNCGKLNSNKMSSVVRSFAPQLSNIVEGTQLNANASVLTGTKDKSVGNLLDKGKNRGTDSSNTTEKGKGSYKVANMSTHRGLSYYRNLGKHLDTIFFVLFLSVWILTTVYYMISLFG